MRLRQVALVATQLKPVREDLFAVLGLIDDFQDTGVAEFGLENSVMVLGDTYLEVVAPVTENTTAGRLLERRGGDGGYMVIVQVDDLESCSRRADELGVRKVWEVDLPDAKAFHMHPKDLAQGPITSFDQMTPIESWRWAGPRWETRQASLVDGIVAVEIQTSDVKEMSKRWSEVFDTEITTDGENCSLALDRSLIRFVEDRNGRGNGVSGIDIQTNHLDAVLALARQRSLTVSGNAVTLCGVTINFIPTDI